MAIAALERALQVEQPARALAQQFRGHATVDAEGLQLALGQAAAEPSTAASPKVVPGITTPPAPTSAWWPKRTGALCTRVNSAGRVGLVIHSPPKSSLEEYTDALPEMPQ